MPKKYQGVKARKRPYKQYEIKLTGEKPPCFYSDF